jgi:rhamnosyltransferase
MNTPSKYTEKNIQLNRDASSLTILYQYDVDAVIKAADSYVFRFAHAIFIDNSPAPDAAFEKKMTDRYGSKFVYIPNHSNKGVGYALNQGFTHAAQLDSSWVLTMDQDSWFASDHFFETLEAQGENSSIAIYAAGMHKSPPFRKKYNADWWKVPAVITSGNLVRMAAWKSIDGFQEKWFIDDVDHEFCLRLKQKNWSILSSKKEWLSHQLGTTKACRWIITNKVRHISLHSPERTYYIIRNAWFILFKHGWRHPGFGLNRLSMILIKLMLIVSLYPHKKRYIYWWWKGLSDGIFQKLDRQVL